MDDIVNSGDVIVFESGTYYINNSISLVNKSNIIITTFDLYSYKNKTFRYISNINRSINTSVLLFDINPFAQLSQHVQQPSMFDIDTCFNITIENLYFSTNINYTTDIDNYSTKADINKFSSLVRTYNSNYLVFNNVHFSFANVSNIFSNEYTDMYKYNSTFALIDIQDITNIQLINCKFESNTLTNGVLIKSKSPNTNRHVLFVDMNNIVISNNTFYQSGGLMYAYNNGINLNNSQITNNIGMTDLNTDQYNYPTQTQFYGIFTIFNDDNMINQLKFQHEFLVQVKGTDFQHNVNISLGYFATSLVLALTSQLLLYFLFLFLFLCFDFL